MATKTKGSLATEPNVVNPLVLHLHSDLGVPNTEFWNTPPQVSFNSKDLLLVSLFGDDCPIPTLPFESIFNEPVKLPIPFAVPILIRPLKAFNPPTVVPLSDVNSKTLYPPVVEPYIDWSPEVCITNLAAVVTSVPIPTFVPLS